MLFPLRALTGILDGTVTVAYRRWDAPRAKPGGRQLTRIGVVVIDSVEQVDDPTALTDADARAAGERDRATLLRWLTKTPGPVYRIGVHYGGPDPRLALRADLPDEVELAQIGRKLDRMDAGVIGPWTTQYLTWIRDHPEVVSTELATLVGRERQAMKTDIRRLKALGLTVSLPVGYRLSPRGEAYLMWRNRSSRGRHDQHLDQPSRQT